MTIVLLSLVVSKPHLHLATIEILLENNFSTTVSSWFELLNSPPNAESFNGEANDESETVSDIVFLELILAGVEFGESHESLLIEPELVTDEIDFTSDLTSDNS